LKLGQIEVKCLNAARDDDHPVTPSKKRAKKKAFHFMGEQNTGDSNKEHQDYIGDLSVKKEVRPMMITKILRPWS